MQVWQSCQTWSRPVIKQVFLSQFDELLDKVFALHSIAIICFRLKPRGLFLSAGLHKARHSAKCRIFCLPPGLEEPHCLAACTSGLSLPVRRQRLQGAASTNIILTGRCACTHSVHLRMICLHDEQIIFRNVLHSA